MAADRGFLGYFDRGFAPLAKPLGVSSESLAEAHAPDMLANVIRLMSEIGLSPFGSLIAQQAVALGVSLISAASKSSTVGGDKIMATHIASNLFWGGLHYANPKISGQVMSGASAFGEAIRNGDFAGMLAALTSGTNLGAAGQQIISAAPAAVPAQPTYVPQQVQQSEQASSSGGSSSNNDVSIRAAAGETPRPVDTSQAIPMPAGPVGLTPQKPSSKETPITSTLGKVKVH